MITFSPSTKSIREVHVTTKDLFDNFSASNLDILWSDPNDFDSNLITQLRAIAQENMEGIRQFFKDGYTSSLMGEAMETMEEIVDKGDELEIRVFNKANKLLGVVIHSEINY